MSIVQPQARPDPDPARPVANAMETIWTIGHSTLPFAEFVSILGVHGVETIIDVRRFPGSRRHPWFASESLRESLPAEGVGYAWLPQLGGRRRPLPDSHNTGWNNPSFQGYADHLDSAEFAEGLQAALELAARAPSALMCAEAPWWRCHRALISDVLKLRGIQVCHIMGPGPARPHPWTAPARIEDGRLCYPPSQERLL